MELLIMGLRDAMIYRPNKPTYAIRIFSSWDRLSPLTPLKESEFYIAQPSYVFDDNDEYFKAGPVELTIKIAELMLKDFMNYRAGIESLLIHCTHGKNRSPAVGIAFNEIFNLGHDHIELVKKYRHYNAYVNNILIKAAENLGIK